MLIGLHSDGSRAGKDSVAAILVSKYGFRQVALANAIRQLLLDLNPLIHDDKGELFTMRGLFEYYDEDWDKVKAVSRESVDYMIRLGQSARDIIGEDVWIDAAFPSHSFDPLENIVISDIRQPNEVDWVLENYGELWYVERPGVSEKRGMDGLLKDVTFDAHIVNDGTLEDLTADVDAIMQQDLF